MKRFIFTVLCVSVFFTGLGSLIESASASLKSDDKALELLRKARAAIGGDQAVGGVRSMTITGKATKTFETEGVIMRCSIYILMQSFHFRKVANYFS